MLTPIARFARRVAVPAVALSALTAPLSTPRSVWAAPTFVVNSSADAVAGGDLSNGICETAPGNNVCTLRAAIMKANHFPGGGATIDATRIPGGIVTLTIPPSGGNDEDTGDLDITANMAIVGARPTATIIDGNGSFTNTRVLAVHPGVVATVSGVTLRNGNTPLSGGGINNAGTLTLIDSIVSDNTAAGDGGGIFNGDASTIRVINTTVSSNATQSRGGGLFNANAGTANIINSTISGNRSAGDGGGIFNAVLDYPLVPHTVRVISTTVANNTADSDLNGTGQGGGIATAPESEVFLVNSIVADNSDTMQFGSSWVPTGGDCSGEITSLSFNVVENVNTMRCHTVGPTSQVDPLLGPLQFNGGPTPTHAPSRSSEAVTHANPDCTDLLGGPLLTDQRGHHRPPDGPCHMGAFQIGSRLVRDANSDGRADLFWRHSSGLVSVWLLDGFNLIGSGSPGTAPTEWTIVGVADVNGDRKADIVWRHTSGLVAIWLLDGPSFLGSGFLGSASLDWTVAGVGDVNGDGKADIVWRHTSGAVHVWLLDGTTILATGSLGNVSADWTTVGLSDVNGDGRADLVWRHTLGTVAVWFLDGSTIIGSGFPGSAPPEWTLEAVGDVNADGRADLVWRHASGTVVVWLLDGLSIIGTIFRGTADADWTLAGLADVDGDGRADLVWRHTSGLVHIWLMSPVSNFASGSPGSAPTSWSLE
jgi:hypothetical protein